MTSTLTRPTGVTMGARASVRASAAQGGSTAYHTTDPWYAAASMRTGTAGSPGYVPVHAALRSESTGDVHSGAMAVKAAGSRPASRKNGRQSGSTDDGAASCVGGTATKLRRRPRG